jgi:hypothetical protein
MDKPEPNPILETALALIEAAVPGAFDDPVEAWRAYVPSLRYVVIDRAAHLSVTQLKAIQDFSSSFSESTARNLLEIRKELAEREIRLEPVPESFAVANVEVLIAQSVQAHMEPLSEEEKRERLNILDELPPPDAASIG